MLQALHHCTPCMRAHLPLSRLTDLLACTRHRRIIGTLACAIHFQRSLTCNKPWCALSAKTVKSPPVLYSSGAVTKPRSNGAAHLRSIVHASNASQTNKIASPHLVGLAFVCTCVCVCSLSCLAFLASVCACVWVRERGTPPVKRACAGPLCRVCVYVCVLCHV